MVLVDGLDTLWFFLRQQGYISLFEPKYFGGKVYCLGWRRFTSCERLLWENLFHNQCILLVVTVAM